MVQQIKHIKINVQSNKSTNNNISFYTISNQNARTFNIKFGEPKKAQQIIKLFYFHLGMHPFSNLIRENVVDGRVEVVGIKENESDHHLRRQLLKEMEEFNPEVLYVNRIIYKTPNIVCHLKIRMTDEPFRIAASNSNNYSAKNKCEFRINKQKSGSGWPLFYVFVLFFIIFSYKRTHERTHTYTHTP